MANIKAKDADGNDIYLKAAGSLTDLDPGVKEFTETNSAAILADTAAIDTGVSAIAAAVSGSEVQVDIVAALPAGTNNIGDVDVATLPAVNLAAPTISYATGTITASGDNTVLDISALAGYSAGDNLVVTHLTVQNESATASTAIIKNGATAIARVLGQSQGDGIAYVFPPGREMRLSDDADLIINLSGANAHGYSIGYYLEA